MQVGAAATGNGIEGAVGLLDQLAMSPSSATQSKPEGRGLHRGERPDRQVRAAGPPWVMRSYRCYMNGACNRMNILQMHGKRRLL
jgi:hypothetical protein